MAVNPIIIMKMKTRIIYLFTILCLLILNSCKREPENVNVVGEWELTDVILNTKAIQIGDEKIEVYLSFTSAGTFNIWQKLGSGKFVAYDGKYSVAENILTGEYSDGTPLGNTYKVEVSGSMLIMRALENSTDVYTYTECSIPSEIK